MACVPEWLPPNGKAMRNLVPCCTPCAHMYCTLRLPQQLPVCVVGFFMPAMQVLIP